MQKKLLIVRNNCPWQSWPLKVADIRGFFASKFDLQIDFIDTKYSVISFSEFAASDPKEQALPYRFGVEPGWYHQHVTPLAIDYDMVLFVLSASQKAGRPRFSPG